MKRSVFVLIFLLFFSLFITAQDAGSVLAAMQKNFARGSISTKIQVLQSSIEYSDVDMGPLYSQAIEFIIDNSKNLASDITTREMTILAVRLAGLNRYSESAFRVWKLFDLYEDTAVRVEILGALGSMDPDPAVVSELNKWLGEQNNKFRSGESVEEQVVSEAVVTLGKLGDRSSFPVIFSTGSANYSEDITYKAKQALKLIDGSYSESLLNVIIESVPSDKLSALKLAIDDNESYIEERGNLLKRTLEVGLNSKAANSSDEELLRELRFIVIRELTRLKWADAGSLVIEHFNQVIVEYERGIVSKSNFLEAVECLGSIGTHEAAARLTLYLEVMNSNMENGQDVDQQIAMAVIVNIGIIGDTIAFDHLLYSGYLDYSAPVKKAAREALNKLKNK